ncbi:MAG TPA: M14 family metallopeptidase [Gemmatimonadaceae bacterium]|nr:M14 family metallopeptidase [Gemmatimonadaceae bacterium]
MLPHPYSSLRAAAVVATVTATLACSGTGGTASTPGAPNGVATAFVPPAVTDPRLPRTRAERSNYTETSRYADVVAFIDSLRNIGAPIAVGTAGTTNEKRTLPYVIASRPLVSTPAAARSSGKPIVYVQGNIHAGEVEGKEALQALVRDLVFQTRPNVLDSIVLIAVPIYNADGNERFADQARNRGSQNGPQLVGQRPNAQGLDLNRDYMKVDAPETSSSLAMFKAWNPDVFVDLHTTNGSYHGYALTYAPPLNPAANIAPGFIAGGYTRDSILPELRQRVRTRRGYETFDYGNFASQDSAERGWFTYDHRPRFGTNYYGLRGRVAVLSEAYSHDPFPRRVASTYSFLSELLSLVAERGARVRAIAASADSAVVAWGVRGAGPEIPIRASLTTTPLTGEVIVEDLVSTGDTTRTEPGVRRGMRRTGNFRRVRMPIYDRFVPTLTTAPAWGFAVSGTDTSAVRVLGLHGVSVQRVTAPCTVSAETFASDSVIVSPSAFQGRREVRVTGRWQRADARLESGTYVVALAQPLGVVTTYLLDPRSDDGLVAWNVGNRVANGRLELAPTRLAAPLPAACGLGPA